jgi:uncharacterized protein
MLTFIIIVCVFLMIAGFIGCIVPFIPGPPICYLSLLIFNFATPFDVDTDFLIEWAVIMVAITALDVWLQVYGVKRFGGKKKAINGTLVGLVLGIFIPPFGIVIGPFVGAFIGAYLDEKDDFKKVIKIALGALVGFLSGVVLKVVVCGIMAYQFITLLLNG